MKNRQLCLRFLCNTARKKTTLVSPQYICTCNLPCAHLSGLNKSSNDNKDYFSIAFLTFMRFSFLKSLVPTSIIRTYNSHNFLKYGIFFSFAWVNSFIPYHQSNKQEMNWMSVDHVDHECLVPLQTFHTEHALKPVPEFTSSFLMSWVFFS